jgi:ABC-type amino acid transport substrate-binding protein
VGNSHLSRFALRRRLIALAVSALLVGAGAEPPALARPLDAVRETGKLRVAVYRDYKPYSWIQDGKNLGIDVEIAEAIAKSLDVNLDVFVLRADDDLDDDLRNGVWKGTVFGTAPGDVMMHVPYDKRIEAKNDRVFLVAPYHVDSLAVAVDPAKASEALDLSLFLHDKVAVDVGTLADMVLISAFDQRVLPNVVHQRGVERAADAFERGEVAAFAGEASAVQALAKKGQRPFAIVYPKTILQAEWSVGMAVRSDSRDLGDYVDEAMSKLEASGEIDRIFAKYGVDWRKPEIAK